MTCQSRIRFKTQYGRKNINNVCGSKTPVTGDKGKLFLKKGGGRLTQYTHMIKSNQRSSVIQQLLSKNTGLVIQLIFIKDLAVKK
jgi:hypothetical protein